LTKVCAICGHSTEGTAPLYAVSAQQNNLNEKTDTRSAKVANTLIQLSPR
jgi:hypothetical protein